MTAGGRERVVLPAGFRERVLKASRQARAAGHCRPGDHGDLCSRGVQPRGRRPIRAVVCAERRNWRYSPAWPGRAGPGRSPDRRRGGRAPLPVRRPGSGQANHIESTQSAAARQAGRPAARTRADWRRAAGRTLDLVRGFGDPCAEVAVHGMRLPLGALLVVRVFELWTHDNDIRRAVGLPASVPDAPALRLMTGLAARLLPHCRGPDRPARTGQRAPGAHRPRRRHLGCRGRRAPARSCLHPHRHRRGRVCRLAANRVTPADLDLHVTGDPGRAAGVLAAASALALD